MGLTLVPYGFLGILIALAELRQAPEVRRREAVAVVRHIQRAVRAFLGMENNFDAAGVPLAIFSCEQCVVSVLNQLN